MRLGLDDIQGVYEYLQRKSGAPVIALGEHATASDVDSLKDATRAELERLAIWAFENRLLVGLAADGAVVRWRTTDAEVAEAAKACIALLRTSRVLEPFAGIWYFGRAAIISAVGLTVVGALLVGSIALFDRDIDWTIPPLFAALPLLMASTMTIDAYIGSKRRWSKAVVKPWFRRERRQLILERNTAIVASVIGTLLTVLVGFALGAISQR